MKKLYIFAILFVFLSLGANAQSFKILSDDGLTDYTGDTMIVYGDPWDAPIPAPASIQNLSGATRNIKVRRTVLEVPMTAGVLYEFCWTLCYAPFISVSPDAIAVNDNEVLEDKFIGHLHPDGNVGSYFIHYKFFDETDTTISSSFTVNYRTNLGVGVEPVTASALSNVYPNPARDVVNFDYTLAAGSSASVSLFDLAGNKVKEIKLNAGSTQIKSDVSALKSGVYFYSLNINGKAVFTKRLIIAR